MIKDKLELDYVDKCLKKISKRNLSKNVELWMYFKILYETGLRPVTLERPDKWRKINQLFYEVETAKTGATRMIAVDPIPHAFRASIDDRVPYFYRKHYWEARRFYIENCPCANIWIGNKRVELYLFRYVYAQKLYQKTKDIKKVMARMGWRSEKTARKYTSAVFHTNQYTIPFRD